MKRVIKIVFISFFSIILTGCWNYREVNEDFIVTAAAIDKIEEGYLVTVEITYPKKGSEAALENDYIIEQGRTIFEAIRKTIMQTGKKLYWGHAKVIIVCKEIAEEGILPLLDFLARDTEVRNKVWLLVSLEDSASILLKGKDEIHNAIGFHIDEVLSNQNKIGMFYAVDLLTFLDDLGAEGLSPTLPTSKLTPSRESTVPRVEGAAIFKDDKMIGTIEGSEVRIFLIVTDKFKGGEFTTLALDNVRVTLEVYESKTKLKPVVIDGEVVMDISVNMKVGIVDMDSEENYMSDDKLELIRKNAEKSIANDIEKFIKKIQNEYKADIFGFGNTIYRMQPKIWKEIKDSWEQEFSKLQVQTHVNITIEGVGLLDEQLRGAY